MVEYYVKSRGVWTINPAAVRLLRKGKGWTVPVLADLIGVNPQTIRNLEHNRRGGDINTLVRLSDAFECQPTDLLICRRGGKK